MGGDWSKPSGAQLGQEWRSFNCERSGGGGLQKLHSYIRANRMVESGDSKIGGSEGNSMGRKGGTATVHQMCITSLLGAQNRTKEMEIGDRQQEIKCHDGGSNLQVRRNRSDNSESGQGLVVHHMGSCSGVSPCSDDQGISNVARISGGRGLVCVPGDPIWNEVVSFHLHKGSSSNDQAVEKDGIVNNILCGRFLLNPQRERDSYHAERQLHHSTDGQAGMGEGGNQRVLGTNSTRRDIGMVDRYSLWNDNIARKKSTQDSEGDEEGLQKQYHDQERVVTGCRACAVNTESLCSSKALLSGMVQSHQELSRRVEAASSVDCQGKGRCSMDPYTSERLQWSSSVDSISCYPTQFRCNARGMGCLLHGAGGKRGFSTMGDRRTHLHFGDKSSEVGTGILCRCGEREDSGIENRQQDNKGSPREGGKQEATRVDRASERDLVLGNSKPGGLPYLQVGQRCDRQCGSRQSIQKEGFCRLDVEERYIPCIGSLVGTTHHRQDGRQHQQTGGKVQQSMEMPRNRSSQHFHPELGGGKQLGCASICYDPFCPSACMGVSSRSNSHHPPLGISTLVAPIIAADNRQDSVGKRMSVFPRGSVRLCGTLEKSNLGVLGSQTARQEARLPTLADLIRKRATLLKQARAPTTHVRYAKLWKQFEAFAAVQSSQSLPAKEDLVLDYIAWLDLTGVGQSARVALAAIAAAHKDGGLPDPTCSHVVRNTLNGLERQLAQEKQPKRPREGLPVDALHTWIALQGGGCSTWKRDAALVGIGLRTMRRASEIAALQLEDVQFKADGLLWIRIRKSKTDQLAKGLEIPVEATGSNWCPHRLLRMYLEERGSAAGPLFLSNQGKQLSTSAISSIVKRVAALAHLPGRYSSHSLRIGGATAAMIAGLSLEQIKAIGNWQSEAVMRYLRLTQTAFLDVSKRMGF